MEDCIMRGKNCESEVYLSGNCTMQVLKGGETLDYASMNHVSFGNAPFIAISQAFGLYAISHEKPHTVLLTPT